MRSLAGHEEEVVAAYTAGATLDELCERYGCSVNALRTFLRARGVRMRPSGAPWPYDRETELLIAEEYESGFPAKKLAARYGGDERTIRKAVRKQGGTIRTPGAAPAEAALADDERVDGAGPAGAFRILVGASVIFTVLLGGAYLLSYWNSDEPALASSREAAASTTEEPAAAPPSTSTSTSAPSPSTTTTAAPSSTPTPTSTTVPGPPYQVTMTTCQQVGDDLTITGTLLNRSGEAQSYRVQVLVVDADGVTLDESTVTSRTLDDGDKATWTARATSEVDLRSGGGSCLLGTVQPIGG